MADIGGGSLNLVTTDAGDLYDQTLIALEQAIGEPLYPGDERREFAEAMVAVLLASYNSVEDAARQTTLRYARGEVLDALGERLGVHRLGAEPAKCTMRFTLSDLRSKPVIIPLGTKVTADSEVYFATDREVVIDAGQWSVDVTATATQSGSIGNGYPPGTITTLVDLIAFMDSVTNLTESEGGDDGEPYSIEGDDRFRARIKIAPEKLSVAGPEMAYVYWALTADAGIVDVAAISETETYEQVAEVHDGRVYIGGELLIPDHLEVNGSTEGFDYTYENWLLTITLGPELRNLSTVTVKLEHKMDGRVRIVPLMEGGQAPSQEVIDKVYEICNARDIRPMTDVVRVDPPYFVEYDIDLTYYVTPETEGKVVDTVEGTDGAIERYIADQAAVLGRDINPDVLITYMMDPDWDETLTGVIHVDVRQPVYTPVEQGAVARFSGNINVTHKLETRARWDGWT